MVLDALADQLPDAGRVVLFVVGTEPRECLTYLDPQGTDERPIFLGWARVQSGGRIDRRGHRTPPNVLGRKATADRRWSQSGCRVDGRAAGAKLSTDRRSTELLEEFRHSTPQP